MLSDQSPSLPYHPHGWHHIVGLAENLGKRDAGETARLNAYHLKLGALAAMHQRRPCDIRIAAIPAQIANTTEAGAIIAQFVTAASMMSGALKVPCYLETQAREFIDAGIHGLKNFYSGQNNPAALYPQHEAILRVIGQVVPECPETVRTIIARAIQNVRPK